MARRLKFASIYDNYINERSKRPYEKCHIVYNSLKKELERQGYKLPTWRSFLTASSRHKRKKI